MNDTHEAHPQLVAYETADVHTMRLVRAPATRSWMAATTDGFAKRCLPLLMANQAGWFVVNTRAVRVRWNGGSHAESLTVDYLQPGEGEPPAVSHFGHGILTWRLPYLFRTSPGYNLLVRGPANHPKDGAFALDGLVETDWTVAKFTVNWQITRPHHFISFDADDPICMLVPQKRGDLEAFHPQVRLLSADPALAADHAAWREDRTRFLDQRRLLGRLAVTVQGWQRHYLRGTSPSSGPEAAEHQVKLTLQDFEDRKQP